MRQEWKEALLSMKRGLAIFLAIAMVFGGTDMTAFANWYDMDQNQKLDYDDIFGYHESYYETIYTDVGDSVVLDIAEYIYKMTNYRIYRGDDDFSYDESEIYDSEETIPLGMKPELLNYTWTKDVWDSGDATDGEDLGTGSVWRISSVTEEDYNYYYSCHVKAEGIDEELAVFRFELNKYPEDGEYRGSSWIEYCANSGERLTLKPDLSNLERYNKAKYEWEAVTDYSGFNYKWFIETYEYDGFNLEEVAETEEYETEPFAENISYVYRVYENDKEIMEGTVYISEASTPGWHLESNRWKDSADVTDTLMAVADESVRYWLWDDVADGVYYYDPETRIKESYGYDADTESYELNLVWKKAGEEEPVCPYSFLDYTPTQEEIDAGLEFVCEIYLVHFEEDSDETSRELLPINYRVKLAQGVAEGTIRCTLAQNEIVCSGVVGDSMNLYAGGDFQIFDYYYNSSDGIEEEWSWINADEYADRIEFRWTRDDNPEILLANKSTYEISELTEDDMKYPFTAGIYIDGVLATSQKFYIKDPNAEYSYKVVMDQAEVENKTVSGKKEVLNLEDVFSFYQVYEDGARSKTSILNIPEDKRSIQWYEEDNPSIILSEEIEYEIDPIEASDFQKTYCCKVELEGQEAVTAIFRFIDEGSVPLHVSGAAAYYVDAIVGTAVTTNILEYMELNKKTDKGYERKNAADYVDRMQFSWYEQSDPNKILSEEAELKIDPFTEEDFAKEYYCKVTVKNEPPEKDSVARIGILYQDASGKFENSRKLIGGTIFASPGDEITLQPKIVDKKSDEEVSEEEYSKYEYTWNRYSNWEGMYYSVSNDLSLTEMVDGRAGECSDGQEFETYDVGVWDPETYTGLSTEFSICLFYEKILEESAYEWDEGTIVREPTGEHTGLIVYKAQSPEYPYYFVYKSIPVLEDDEKAAYDQATAEAVAKMINKLPDNPRTEDADQIEAARSAFGALTDDQIAILGEEYASLGERLEVVETALEQAQLDAENRAAADEVKQMIEALDENAEDYEYEVQEARDAYNALKPEQQALIADAYEDLKAAEQKIADARYAENKEMADGVKEMIEGLDETSDTFERDVNHAREALDDLTDEQKEILGADTLAELESVLSNAETKLAEIKAENDPKKAKEVEDMIRALEPGEDGSYNADDVKAARAAFKALTKDQKALVPQEVKDLLRAAEDALEAAADSDNQEAAEAVENLIQDLNEDAGLEDEADVATAQEAYDNLTEAQKNLVNRDLVRKLEKAAASVETAKAKKAAEEEAAKKAAEEEAAKKAAEEAAAKKAAEEAAKKAAEEAAAKKAAEEAAKKAAAIKKVTSITITSNASNKIAAGKKVKLQAEVLPADAANKAVTWSSSNPKVAKVDANGVVTVLKKTGGRKAVITATAADGSGVTQTFKITSMKGVVKKVKISGKKTVKAGKTLKLKAKVTATKKANKKIAWESSNTEYATVKNGKVKALKAGKGKKVTITAKATDGSGKKAKIKIKIK